jgi:hypothetical protein
MCTLVGKKFPNIGWIGVKNRDRSAPTYTKYSRILRDDLERVTLIDETTHWSEGMNSNGVSIISSSLHPVIHNEPEHLSKNGTKIRGALSKRTVESAVEFLLQSKVSGCVMVFDKNQMFVIEGEEKTHKIAVEEITDNAVVRTNHGILIPSAGYQPFEKNHVLEERRISSEARYLIGMYVGEFAKNPEDLMVWLAHEWDDNPQLTTLRKPYSSIQTRTTEQLLLKPYENIMLLRSTDGKLDFGQLNVNTEISKVLIGIDYS